MKTKLQSIPITFAVVGSTNMRKLILILCAAAALAQVRIPGPGGVAATGGGGTITDSFTGADGTGLTSYNPCWISNQNVWEILGNSAHPISSVASIYHWDSVCTPVAPDQFAQATISGPDAGCTVLGTPYVGIVNAGDVIRLEVSGTSLTCKQNGTVRITATDSSISSGQPGLWSYSSGTATLDAFQGGN